MNTRLFVFTCIFAILLAIAAIAMALVAYTCDVYRPKRWWIYIALSILLYVNGIAVALISPFVL